MAVSQRWSKRKPSGGRFKPANKKRLTHAMGVSALTKLSEKKVKIKRGRSGLHKRTLLSTTKVNVVNQKTKKLQVTDIQNIVENPANRHFVRRNIMNKGTVVETPLGRVKITSRPGQIGTVNGILLEQKKA